MALLVGTQGRVLAYEAVPHYFRLLQKSVKANGLSNVIPKLAVVGANAGWATIPSRMLTGNIARPGKLARLASDPTEKPLAEVPVVRLDDEVDWLDAAKVDCEGYEVQVLKGMRRLVGINPGLILFLEVHERQLAEVGDTLSELAELVLEKYGLKRHPIGYKHCICSHIDLPHVRYRRLSNPEDFVDYFHGT